MLKSSNIHIMSNALLKASKVLRRDFNELEMLQNSKTGTENFVDSSLRTIKELIYADLVKARPEIEIYYVEEGSSKSIIPNNDNYFIVAPVSGIKNFSKGLSYFATSIALLNKNDISASVIYDPIKDEMFVSEKGKGAFINNSRIRVSSNKDITKSVFVFERASLMQGFIDKNITSDNNNIRVLGSNCLDLANTASGRVDGYFSDKLDDVKLSAGLLILREAGGIKIDLNDSNYSIMTNNLLAETFKG